MIRARWNAESTSEEILDELYSVLNGTAGKDFVSAYKELEETIFLALAGQKTGASKGWYKLLKADTPLGELYRKLKISEIAILLEVSEKTHFTNIVLVASRRLFLKSLMEDSKTSENLKLALATIFWSSDIVSHWLCKTGGGRYLPFIVNMVQPKETENVLSKILAPSMFAILEHGETKLNDLADDVVTKEFLTLLLPMLKLIFKNNGEAQAVLATHARRLYNFDESLPDEWIIRAIA